MICIGVYIFNFITIRIATWLLIFYLLVTLTQREKYIKTKLQTKTNRFETNMAQRGQHFFILLFVCLNDNLKVNENNEENTYTTGMTMSTRVWHAAAAQDC